MCDVTHRAVVGRLAGAGRGAAAAQRGARAGGASHPSHRCSCLKISRRCNLCRLSQGTRRCAVCRFNKYQDGYDATFTHLTACPAQQPARSLRREARHWRLRTCVQRQSPTLQGRSWWRSRRRRVSQHRRRSLLLRQKSRTSRRLTFWSPSPSRPCQVSSDAGTFLYSHGQHCKTHLDWVIRADDACSAGPASY